MYTRILLQENEVKSIHFSITKNLSKQTLFATIGIFPSYILEIEKGKTIKMFIKKLRELDAMMEKDDA